MGFETERFASNIRDEFICNICKLVLEDPVQVLKHFTTVLP